MLSVSTAARRLEEENTRLRREVADLQDINRKLAAKIAVDNASARAEVTRLREQFAALADAGLLAPDLPEGWRLADHKVYGRVIVTTEKPDDDGLVAFVHRDDDLHRQHAHDWCKPDELTYLDTDQEPTDG